MDCSSGNVCYISNDCDCNTTSCRETFQLNECKNGKGIYYENLNYLERNYCTQSEGYDSTSCMLKPEGLVVFRKQKCVEGLEIKCGINKFEIFSCGNGEKIGESSNGVCKFMVDRGVPIFYQTVDRDFLQRPNRSSATKTLLISISTCIISTLLVLLLL
ncbi:hypothetical protein DLAC_07570 [Tieghemostelium lacteum]|uniref:Uncharacterized protein n=1 Tax=Tieghemostelium lacteum TaxID=361077 RepID=A0A151ZCU6_TIELA|nr:hypothetical protein DLAC_07570 [Tieghemostelium lacteum]|eukprot:KYQ91776.1 hypothetical protein DLAC_07570 [Tieghemostelium lacteum]